MTNVCFVELMSYVIFLLAPPPLHFNCDFGFLILSDAVSFLTVLQLFVVLCGVTVL